MVAKYIHYIVIADDKLAAGYFLVFRHFDKTECDV